MLFDLHGTLAETDSLHLPTWLDVLRPHGIEVDEAFYKENISGRSNGDVVRELLPGLLDFLKQARERGLKTALVTNAPQENVEAILLALELEEFFDEVVLSDEVGPVKPDPAPYRAALDKLGIAPEEAVAFEDSTSGISSSVGAGIPTVGIASTQDPEKLRRAGAFTTAKDFTDPELLEFLRSPS